MARNEAALRELLARYQPELAGRLAKRIAQYGATDAVLAEGAKPEPSPLLRDIIDAALAEELGDGGLFDETAVPQAAQAARVTDVAKGSGLEGGARGARGAPAHQADAPDSLLQRLARYQPELAPQLLRRIEHEGSDIVAQCLRSDSALRRHMERALEELFADEDQAQADSAELGRGSGSHMLPGQRKTLAISSRPKVDPAIRSIRSSAPSLAAPAATTSPSPGASAPRHASVATAEASGEIYEGDPVLAIRLWPPVGANAPGAPRRPEAEGLTPEAMDTGFATSQRMWGLQEFLSELGLSDYEEAALTWAKQMGAVFLEELVENAQDLSEALEMKPLERKRLERQGSQVLARLTAQRPRRVQMAKPDAPSATPQAPKPEELPMALFGR